MSIMKKIIIFILILGCIYGCTPTPQHKEESFSLNKNRIQVKLNDDIDYLSYVEANDDLKNEIKYNEIDTSKTGTYEIQYTNQKQKQTLIVDVVQMYENSIFNPLDINPEVIKNPEDITSLVNKVYQIPEGWVPDDLVTVVDSHQQLRKEAADAYAQFYNAAKEKGIQCFAISGYRKEETQKLYWTRQVDIRGIEYASLYSAYPNRSEHQLGLAIDVSYKTTGDRLSESVEDSDIGKFIVSDGYKYGFILRYPKDKISTTNYGYEPWHMRYVGKELATILHEQNLTLEEYKEMNHENS